MARSSSIALMARPSPSRATGGVSAADRRVRIPLPPDPPCTGMLTASPDLVQEAGDGGYRPGRMSAATRASGGSAVRADLDLGRIVLVVPSGLADGLHHPCASFLVHSVEEE